jgi:hypothetical protein
LSLLWRENNIKCNILDMEVVMDKNCSNCKYCQHPEWAILVPGFMICVHTKVNDVGRLDVQRVMDDDEHCGPTAKWWEFKNDI